MNDTTTETKTFRSPGIILLLITLFTAVTRFWNYWGDRMHVDEWFTLNLVKYDYQYIIWKSLTTDCNPPLFYVIDRLSIVALGANQVGQRFPSVIFGILLIPAVYQLGKEYRDQTLGLLAALAMATMGSMWFYSQFGRSYMLNCLLFTVLCIYYLRLVREDERMGNWFGLSLFTVLLAYSHLYACVPLAVLWTYLLVRKTIPAINYTILVGVASLPLAVLFNAILKERTVSREVAKTAWNWYGISWQQILIWSPLEFFGFCAFIWIPIITYAVYRYRKDTFTVMVALSFVAAYTGLILLSDTTPVFIRYVLLFVPVLCTIGLNAAMDVVQGDSESLPRQLRIRLAMIVLAFYIVGTVLPFLTGYYIEKGQLSPTMVFFG